MEYRLTHYELKQGTGRRNKGLNVFVESLNLAQLFIIWSIGMDLKKVMSFFCFEISENNYNHYCNILKVTSFIVSL